MKSEEKIKLPEERIIEIEKYIQEKKYVKTLFKAKKNESYKFLYKCFLWELNQIIIDNSIDKKLKEKKINETIKTYYFDYINILQKNKKMDEEDANPNDCYSPQATEMVVKRGNENTENKIQEDKRFKILDDLRKKNIISVFETEAILKKVDKAFEPQYLKEKVFTKEAEKMLFRRANIRLAWHLNNK